MISSPSRLNEPSHSSLVIDASVVINLLGTGNAAEVLRSLGRKTLVDHLALSEVTRNPLNNCSASEVLAELIDAGLLHPVRLSDEKYEIFLELTGAPPPNDLDDGEAATLAHAIQDSVVAVIDERKATRVAALRTEPPVLLHTLDLLSSRILTATLSQSTISDFVHGALLHARMRVPYPFRPWVVGLLGPDRTRECPSIGLRNVAGG